MLDTQTIYNQYHIPPNLQEHQRRVASVAREIQDREDIIQACLFHDMANIIKFNFTKMPGIIEPEKIPYWQGIQQDFITKYGPDIHQATLQICQEIGLPDQVIQTIDQAEWNNTPVLIKTNNLPSAILVYADMRVGPFGILSASDRITNLATRSKIDVPQLLQYATDLEAYLQPITSTKLENIS